MVAVPQVVMLDTSLLGAMSRDYWIADRFDVVRQTIDRLTAANCYVGLTFHHITELIRHQDPGVVTNRLDFLRVLPLVAWVRPYDGNWFPGDIVDIHLREIEFRLNTGPSSVEVTIDHLRPSIWETGTGAEIIQKEFEGWGPLRSLAHELLQDEIYIASITRPDVGQIMNMTLAELMKLPIRPKNERAQFLELFSARLQQQLLKHGDKRLPHADVASRTFAVSALLRVEEAEKSSDDPLAALLLERGIDEDSLDPAMTVEDLALLTIFARRLQLLGEKLRPPTLLTLRDIDMGSLPSWLINQELMRAHWRERRVSASNLGDADIAGIGLYADVCVVDKRTHDYLRQSRKRIPSPKKLLALYTKASDYRRVLECVRATVPLQG